METYVYLNPDDLYVGDGIDKISTYNMILETMLGMQSCLEEMGSSERGVSRKWAARCRVYSKRGAQAIEMLRRSAEL